jgi:presenilin-like A22 family membrane protease
MQQYQRKSGRNLNNNQKLRLVKKFVFLNFNLYLCNMKNEWNFRKLLSSELNKFLIVAFVVTLALFLYVRYVEGVKDLF